MNKMKIIFVQDSDEDFARHSSLSNNQIEELCKLNNFEGDFKESILLTSFAAKENSPTIILGTKGIDSSEDYLVLGAVMSRHIDSDTELEFTGLIEDFDWQKFYLGAMLQQYRFNEYKEEDFTPAKMTSKEFKNLDEIEVVANSVMWVKDQINRPSLDKSPEQFVESVKTFVSGIDIVAHDHSWLVKNNFGAVLGVAKGSERQPFLLEGVYNPSSKFQIALIGKGVMFDSGGLSLKSPLGMSTMKTDMSGAATAWGVMNSISMMNLDIGVRVLTPLVENMPSGSSIRPGDVLITRNNKTIEVLNTDAEGRLIMADALAYAAEEKPDLLIDVSTLTGASKVALGTDIGAVLSNNEQYAKKFIDSSKEFGEIFFSLPLYSGYKNLIESDIADMKNTGGRFGGAITAALLLEEFIDGLPWIHLDIAGPARSSDTDLVTGKGATGFGVMGLFNFIKVISQSSVVEETIS